jgi:hypothetical protein
MIFSANKIFKYCKLSILIVLYGLFVLFDSVSQGNETSHFIAKIVADEVHNFFDKPCYIEDFIQKLEQGRENPQINHETRVLLPYIIYTEMFLMEMEINYRFPTIQDCLNSGHAEKNDWYYFMKFKWQFNFAIDVKKAIIDRAYSNYLSKYQTVQRDIINKTEISDYEKRAKLGDLIAISELRRYYEYPKRDDYNPEQTEARFWMFKAIELGDEESMLEAGYERPYSVRSELSYGDLIIAVDVACDGIGDSESTPYPGCFLYNLLVGENLAQIGYLVLVKDHLSKLSTRPQIVSVIKIQNQVMVELTSFADGEPLNVRRDYFSLEGQYLGNNQSISSANYFWNFRGLSSPAKAELQMINTSDSEIISQITIRTLPYIESFLFWEIDYPDEKRLKGLDEIIPIKDRPQNFGNMPTEVCKQIRIKFSELSAKNIVFRKRMESFFNIDLYSGIRIDSKAYSTLLPLEKGYYKLNYDYLYDPCKFHSPRSLFNELFFLCDSTNAFTAYENLKQRPTYLIELGSDIETVRMLQVCRYLNHFTIDDGYYSNPPPCYAIQIRAQTKDGYKYHYVINAVPQATDPKFCSHGMYSSINIAKADEIDGNDYFVLSNLLDNAQELTETNSSIRVDVFDEEFRYLGSNNPAFSKIMVPGYKNLPDGFAKQLNRWFQSNGVMSYRPISDGGYHSAYPECADIIIEQRRHLNTIDTEKIK